MRHLKMIGLLIVAANLLGCQSNDVSDGRDDANTPRQTFEQPIAAAYIDGVVADRAELSQILIEAHGGEALAELVLDRGVAKRLSQAGLSLTEQDLAAERERVLADLSRDTDDAARLLREMQQRLGLGARRFDALIERNAGLRRLVREGIEVTEPAIQQAYQLRYGKRYIARIITAPDVATLSLARRRAINGTSFTELAIELSTDTSAAQGGLLSPISPADVSYPKAVRDAVSRLTTTSTQSRLSPVIALADGYALLYLESIETRPAPPIDQVRSELASAVRLDLERLRMQQLARAILSQANVVVLDPALAKSWEARREALSDPQ